MKNIRLLALVMLLLPGFTGTVVARAIRIWSYQELFEKSDLVVIAVPTATSDTKERIELIGQTSTGIETRFTVSAMLKGDKALKDFVLHYYRIPEDLEKVIVVVNGPTFVSFAITKDPTMSTHTYLLFLIKEADGRYAPVVGQTDPGGAVRELHAAGYIDPAAGLPE